MVSVVPSVSCEGLVGVQCLVGTQQVEIVSEDSEGDGDGQR